MSRDILPENMNIARIPTSLSDPNNNFFKVWLELMRPMHKLTNKEIDVLGFFLSKYFELRGSISDEELLVKVLLSLETKREIKDGLNMSTSHLHVVLSKLKKLNILTDKGINKKFIPSLKHGGTSYGLMFLFEISP